MTDTRGLFRAVQLLAARYDQIKRHPDMFRMFGDLPAEETSDVLGVLVDAIKTTGKTSNYALLTHRAITQVATVARMPRNAVVPLYLGSCPDPDVYWYAWAAGPTLEDLLAWNREPPSSGALRTLAALRGWNVSELALLPAPDWTATLLMERQEPEPTDT